MWWNGSARASRYAINSKAPRRSAQLGLNVGPVKCVLMVNRQEDWHSYRVNNTSGFRRGHHLTVCTRMTLMESWRGWMDLGLTDWLTDAGSLCSLRSEREDASAEPLAFPDIFPPQSERERQAVTPVNKSPCAARGEYNPSMPEHFSFEPLEPFFLCL